MQTRSGRRTHGSACGKPDNIDEKGAEHENRESAPFRFLGVDSFVSEQEGNSIEGGQAHRSINDSCDKLQISAENGGNQVKTENSYQTPVETTNNHQNEH